MYDIPRTTLSSGIGVGLAVSAMVGVIGCGAIPDETDGAHTFPIESSNGLHAWNGYQGTNGIVGINGLTLANGLTGPGGAATSNGLTLANGLTMTNGLAETSGLMTTDAGRKTVAYLVKCALPAGDRLVKRDQYGTTFTFEGGLGLCPGWKHGGIASDRSCQNMVSACMLAHVNTSGVHVPLWLTSESPRIGWGTNPSYPKQEGTFFGNVMMTGNLSSIAMPNIHGPVAYFCEGAGITAGVVAGRLTAGATNVPYKNPYGANVRCIHGQTVAGPTSPGQSAPDGFKQACANGYCFQNGEPITVWRNPSYVPVFDSAYRYGLAPMSASGKAVDVSYNSTANGTRVQQYASWNTDSQKFTIQRSGSNWRIAMKTNTSKCLSPIGDGTGNGTGIEIQDCKGNKHQDWTITADANTGAFMLRNVAANRCLDVPWGSAADGVGLQLWECFGSTAQKFRVSAGY